MHNFQFPWFDLAKKKFVAFWWKYFTSVIKFSSTYRDLGSGHPVHAKLCSVIKVTINMKWIWVLFALNCIHCMYCIVFKFSLARHKASEEWFTLDSDWWKLHNSNKSHPNSHNNWPSLLSNLCSSNRTVALTVVKNLKKVLLLFLKKLHYLTAWKAFYL